MEETSKKFIENRIKEILTEEMVRVLKRNPGHIALCEVETMPPPELIKGISKYCHEKIEFTLRDEKEAPWEAYCKWEREELKKIHRRRKRKAKKRRKRILKAISGLCPEPPTSVRTLDPGWVFKNKNNFYGACSLAGE